MRVKKRDGTLQDVSFDKITNRIRRLCWELNIDPTIVAQKVIQGVCDGVSTSQLDDLAAQEAFSLESTDLAFGVLAARIAVSNMHRNTTKNIASLVAQLQSHVSPDGQAVPLLSPEVASVMVKHADYLNSIVEHDRDFNYDYFGFRTLCNAYLLKVDGKVVERPQFLFMRYAVEIHRDNMERVAETYKLISRRFCTPASPSLFNAGTNMPQLSSCFLLTIADDSIKGIYDTLQKCAQISRCAGGIGLSVRNIRCRGAYVAGTNGTSDGLVKMLRVFGVSSTHVNQAGKRPGAFAVYVPPFHPDILEFLNLKKNTGNDESRARELFYALFIPDLFMQRVLDDEDWCLFCPNRNRELYNCYGKEFEQLYQQAEKDSARVSKKMKARDLWNEILVAQIETGGPFMLYADACNAKSNQQHLGFISQSNLCTEILQFTSASEIAVCNLQSIILPSYVQNNAFNFDELFNVMRVVVRNLDITITRNAYPVDEARNSNELHRPIGIGCQGLADVFMMLGLPFESKEAMQLNVDIFETMYFAACTASAELAEELGAHPSFAGSPLSLGKFQFDLWGVTPSERYNWQPLREKIMQTGVRNSLFLCQMPTASTAHINGNIESTEALNSNIYVRRTQAGEFALINKHMVQNLMDLGLWSTEVKNEIIADEGSVQNIECIPANLKALYKTVWEIPLKAQINQSIQRAPFICQSQSLNFHLKNPTQAKLTAAHMHAWKGGLKTGMYYLRTNAATGAQQVTVDHAVLKRTRERAEARALEHKPIAAAQSPETKRQKREIVAAPVAAEEEVDGGVCTRGPSCFSCGA